MGYVWAVRFRLDPLNGLDETLNVNALLTDAGGPVLTEIDYNLVLEERIDVNKNVRNRHFGNRPEITFTFQGGDMADFNQLVKIENALTDDEVDVYLSLDSGTTERLVELIGTKGPKALQGKTVTGWEAQMTLMVKGILIKRPDMDASGSIRW